MDCFRAKHYTGKNQFGNEIHYCFVSKRLGGLMQRKKDSWLHRMFELKWFPMFNEEYLAILINTDGLIIFVKYDNVSQHIERDMISQLMELFIKKNVSLSFMDLIKFSEKHALDLKVKFK